LTSDSDNTRLRFTTQMRTLNAREAEDVTAAEAGHVLHLVLAYWTVADSGGSNWGDGNDGCTLAICLRENAVGAACGLSLCGRGCGGWEGARGPEGFGCGGQEQGLGRGRGRVRSGFTRAWVRGQGRRNENNIGRGGAGGRRDAAGDDNVVGID